MTSVRRTSLLAAAALSVAAFVAPAAAQVTLLNVSYDPTRELYVDFNAAFAAHWQQTSGQTITINQSHGGSGSQARAVIDGLDADVVTLALEADINAIVNNSGKIAADWRTRLPNNSAPYTSTIVFLVRQGNPKNILDWGDLVRDDVEVITPNPKTSGGARWNFLAAWAWANREFGGDEAQVTDYVREVYAHVPVLDTAARGSTTTFVERGIGDVLLAWENEAFLALEELDPGAFEIVVPSISILAEPPVAVVDANVDRRGTREAAQAYLEYLYTPEGQEIAAANFYRPSNTEGLPAEALERFPALDLITIDDPLFGGWAEAQPRFFADGGVFDQIYQ